MKIPFDIKYRPQIESGEYKVETRNGESVRIICWDKQGKCPIVIVSCVNGDEGVYTYYENGQYTSNGGNIYDLFIVTPEKEMTEFESSLRQIIEVTLSDEVPNGSGGTMSLAVALSDDDIKKLAPKVLALAKKELLSYADESNPAIEAMADLERTYFCNPDNLPKWLKDDIARKELNAHTKGYNKGYEVATKLYSAPSFIPYSPLYQGRPLCWEPGGTCTNPQMDCINCPRRTTGGGFNTSSGTSTSKAEE